MQALSKYVFKLLSCHGNKDIFTTILKLFINTKGVAILKLFLNTKGVALPKNLRNTYTKSLLIFHCSIKLSKSFISIMQSTSESSITTRI